MRLFGRRTTVVLAASLLVLGAASCTAHSAGAANGVPYTDSYANGTIGFCDKAGNPVTSGSTLDVPFVPTAVSSVGGPPPYNGPRGTATLLAYQPRPGVDPGNWSGQLMTGSSHYSNPAHPMVQATVRDYSLHDFVVAYPPEVDGLVEFRIYLGAPNTPTLTRPYVATDVRVTGDTWTVVRGGNVACNSGTATAVENLVLPSPTISSASPSGGSSPGNTPESSPVTTVPPTNPSQPGASGARSSPPSPGETSQGSPSPGSSLSVGASPSSTSLAAGKRSVRAAASRKSTLFVPLLIIVIVAVLAGALVLMARRRRAGELGP